MDEIIFIILLILVFLIPTVFCVWLVYILYSIPAKSENKKLGILLSTIASITFLYFGCLMLFDDSISKKDVKNYLKEQQLTINDNFEILENKSMSGIGEHYHTFTLKISDSDKEYLISEIKNSDNFVVSNNHPSFIEKRDREYKTGEKIIDNIESENHFIRTLFIQNEKGYAPTYRVIKINKDKNKLQFEDIDE